MVEHPSTKNLVVMLDDECPSPCYMFGGWHPRGAQLNPGLLVDILGRIGESTDPPSVLFLSGAERAVAPSVRLVLKGRSEHVACALVPSERQESAGVPFGSRQVAIAPDVAVWEKNRQHVGRRRLLLHMGRTELGRVDHVVSSRRDGGTVTIRPRDTHLWQAEDYERYKRGLVKSGIEMLVRVAGGEMDQSAIWVLPREDYGRCPAGTTSLTIGPDGLLYPCPAFYRAGEGHSVGDAASPILSYPYSRSDDVCTACGQAYCGGCRFLESGIMGDRRGICRVYESHNSASREIMRRVADSGYLFAGLRTLRSRALPFFVGEGTHEILASKQTHDVTVSEFREALSAVYELARGSADAGLQAREAAPAGVSRAAAGNTPPHSREAAFRSVVERCANGILRMPLLARGRCTTYRAGDNDIGERRSAQEIGANAPPSKRLKDGDIATARSLWRQVIGCRELAGSVTDEERRGFTFPAEARLVGRMLREAQVRMKSWFEETDGLYHWSAAVGYVWAIDFESGIASAKEGPGPAAKLTSKQGHACAGTQSDGQERTRALGRADKEIVSRLWERWGSCCDEARALLGGVTRGESQEEELHGAIERLALARQDMESWLSAMALESGWPIAAGGYRLSEDCASVVAVGEILAD